MKTKCHDFEVDWSIELPDGEEVEVVLRGNYEPFVRGKMYGRPEDCYPDEGGYVEEVEVVEGKVETDFFEWCTVKGVSAKDADGILDALQCQLSDAEENAAYDAMEHRWEIENDR